MAREWILNQAMNRWGLNKKKSVGPVSDLIRKCTPKTLQEWQDYYYSKVYPESYLEEIGKKLYIKITEVIQFEVAEVTEEDCISYIKEVVIIRTFDGYNNEIQTVYGLLLGEIGVPITPAPDEWDRLYNVDFYIEIGKCFIGIQIKPVTFEHTFEDHKWKEMQELSHVKFQNKFGGKVFTVFSAKDGERKVIKIPGIIAEIKTEILRLEKLLSDN